MNEKTDLTSTEELPKEKLVMGPESFENKPKPPFIGLFTIPEGTILCSICKCPGGKLNFVDSLARPWTIKTNSNLVKHQDGTWTHQNPEVCLAAAEIKIAAPTDKSTQLTPTHEHSEDCPKT